MKIDVLIFAWIVTLLSAWGLGMWMEAKKFPVQYERGSYFVIHYHAEYNEYPPTELIKTAYGYTKPEGGEDFIRLRKEAGLEFVLPNSLKEKGVNESK
jgi:hypothetical protein